MLNLFNNKLTTLDLIFYTKLLYALIIEESILCKDIGGPENFNDGILFCSKG
jgi:hypothetical protein